MSTRLTYSRDTARTAAENCDDTYVALCEAAKETHNAALMGDYSSAISHAARTILCAVKAQDAAETLKESLAALKSCVEADTEDRTAVEEGRVYNP